MKKTISLIVLALGASVCFSQNIGARGGLNLANFGGDAENNAMRAGIHVGVYYEHELSDKLRFAPELQLSFQGSNAEEDEFAFDQSLTMLNLPLMVKYMVTDELSINAGPYLGVVMGANAKSDGGDSDISDLFNSLDYGLGLGASYELTSGLNFSLRYFLGLADLTDEDGGTQAFEEDGFLVEVEVEEQRITNQVLQFSVGYKFNK